MLLARSLFFATLLASVSSFECTRGRLFVVDDDNARVAAFDVDDGSFADPVYVETQGPAPAYRIIRTTETNAFVAVINLGSTGFRPGPTDFGSVSFIDAGVKPNLHAVSLDKVDPSAVDFYINCTFPIHFVASDLKIAQFCDGSQEHGINSTVWIVDERKLATGEDALEFSTDLPGSHHGVAVAIDDGHLLHSVPTPERVAGGPSSLPDGFQVVEYNTGDIIHGINEASDPSRSCLGFHGDAHVEGTFAFACNQDHGGILVVNYGQTTTYTSRALFYPEEFETHRTGTLASHHSNSHMVGNFRGGDENHLVSFDPAQQSPNITTDQVQALAASQCAFAFEKSGGHFLFVWMPQGNLQVYIVDSWTLVSDVMVMDNMTECDGTSLVSGHGYAYILSGTSMYEVDVRDAADVTVTSFDLPIVAQIGAVAGVPVGYECSGPATPTRTSRSGASGYVVLHFESEESIEPGSMAQSKFILQLRSDVAKSLGVGIDRIYVLEFGHGFETHEDHHDHDEEDDEDIIVEFFFANAGLYDVNQDSGEALKMALQEMLTNGTTQVLMDGGASQFIEGTILDEPPVAATEAEEKDDDDDDDGGDWPTGATAAIVVVGVLFAVALGAAVLFYKREQKAIFDLEKARIGESA